MFIAAAPPQPAGTSDLRIAMQDAEVMVIEKPPGLASQPGRRGGPSVTALLPPQVSLLHRLDTEASGLLLAARTPLAAAALQQAFDAGAVSRSYVAVVAGSPPDSGCVELRIGPSRPERPDVGPAPVLPARLCPGSAGDHAVSGNRPQPPPAAPQALLLCPHP